MDNKNKYQAELFSNRLSKNLKQLKKWARKNRISSFRAYDKDIPEVPLCLDLYTFLPEDVQTKIEAAKYYSAMNEAISSNSPDAKQKVDAELKRTYAHLYLYERPYEKDDKEEEAWLEEMKDAAARTIGIPSEQVITKTRRHQSDSTKRSQYEKNDSAERKVEGLVMEQGQIFKINLSDYIDTGLFFDHRPLRAKVRELSKGKSVLNLFCYTGSFSVYAAEGGAKSVTSVDMSNTYLNWAKENMSLNEFEGNHLEFVREDVIHYLDSCAAKGMEFDMIVLDPPTFSNSKKTDTLLDINRDWSALVGQCTKILSESGTLYFSTNSRNLKFDGTLLPECVSSKEITPATIPEDYRNNKIHRCWEISRK